MNLLERIRNKQISIDDAQDLLLKLNEDFHQGITNIPWNQNCELSDYEATAYLQGATLEELVMLRYEGWPVSCSDCHQSIDYKGYGWVVVHRNGHFCLLHIKCPAPFLDKQGNDL